MDRAFYVDALAMAERHVAEGQGHIVSQRRIIAKLDDLGADTARAKNLLVTFLATQKQHEHDRQRFINELIKLGVSDAQGS